VDYDDGEKETCVAEDCIRLVGGGAVPSAQSQGANAHFDKDADFELAMALALVQGKKEWKRCRIMIVGESFAGKTALVNSIMGKEFTHNESTVGINQMTCDVSYASIGKGAWSTHDKPERELETALAKMIQLSKQSDITDHGVKLDLVKQPPSDTAIGANSVANENFPHLNASSTIPMPVFASDISDSAIPTGAPNSAEAAAEISSTVISKARSAGDFLAENVDKDLVMKCLGGTVTVNDLIITLSDYGGQTVFNAIHHLFLTPNGVYIVVFNMEWMVAGGAKKERCLGYIRFWLSSITLHTYERGSIAPIVMVGTRKDEVSDPAQREAISELISGTFAATRAWPSVVQNDQLCFFPINNRIGKQDPTLAYLLSKVESTIDRVPSTHQAVPLAWFKCLDEMNRRNKSCLSLQDVKELSLQCNMNDDEVGPFLRFLHDMGMVMWHDEDNLRDIVVIDPIEYLVKPATIVICKHIPDKVDGVHHSKDIHKICQQRCFEDWHILTRHGVATRNVINCLWQEYDHDRRSMLTRLCVKFGLFVPLCEKTSTDVHKYLIPALFPDSTVKLMSSTIHLAPPHTMTCYLVFTSYLEYSSFYECWPFINFKDLATLGFLPSGVFERIVGSALSWDYSTSKSKQSLSISNSMLCKDFAILMFGTVQFSLRSLAHANCIRVDVEAKAPLVVLERLVELTRSVLNECMKSLQFFPALLHNTNKAALPTENETHAYFGGQESECVLLPLDVIRDVIHSRTAIGRLFAKTDLKERYGCWIRSDKLLENYDVFLSYRWGKEHNKHDDLLVKHIFDILAYECVASEEYRQIDVFLGKERLQEGRRFDSDFARALCRSALFMPIVSVEALSRMTAEKRHKAEVDNLLLEWIIALHLVGSPKSKLAAIFPIFIGERRFSSDNICVSISRLSETGVLEELSTDIPEETFRVARILLEENGILIGKEIEEEFFHRSVKDIVKGLMAFMGQEACEVEPQLLVDTLTEKATELLTETYEKNGSLSGPSRGASSERLMSKLDQAWAIMTSRNYIMDEDKLSALCEEFALENAAGLEYVPKTESERLAACLKAVAAGKFMKLLYN
jgi:GTPase SAR1 family protein